MAARYSYNLAREESERRTNSTSIISTPLTIFSHVRSRLFTTPGTKSREDDGEKKIPPLKFDEEDEDEEMKEEDEKKSEDENIYEKILQAENRRLMNFIQELLPSSENPGEDFAILCAERMEELQEEIKILEMRCRSLEEIRLKELEDLRMKHANELEILRGKHQIELDRVGRENQELIDEIINFQIDEIQCWRLEFARDCEGKGGKVSVDGVPPGDLGEVEGKFGGNNVVGMLGNCNVAGIVGNNVEGIPGKLLKEFKELNPVSQRIVVAAFGIATLVIGYYSWPFLRWAWPRIIAFATADAILVAASSILRISNSPAYEEVMDTWKKGEPLTPALFKNFGPEIVAQILKLAPTLFQMARKAKAMP